MSRLISAEDGRILTTEDDRRLLFDGGIVGDLLQENESNLLLEDGYSLLYSSGGRILQTLYQPSVEIDARVSAEMAYTRSGLQPEVSLETDFSFEFTPTHSQHAVEIEAAAEFDLGTVHVGISFPGEAEIHTRTTGQLSVVTVASTPPPGFGTPINRAHHAATLPFELDRFGRPV